MKQIDTKDTDKVSGGVKSNDLGGGCVPEGPGGPYPEYPQFPTVPVVEDGPTGGI